MGTKRIGLARVEALMENLKRELALASAKLTGLTGVQCVATAAVPTADGTGTGTIPDGVSHVTATSADADHILVLPAPTPGSQVTIFAAGAVNFELRTSAPATVKLNNVSGDDKELVVAAGTTLQCICTSATTWIATVHNNVGAPSGGGTPD
ncbi:MAG: hypothetical protein CL431_10690 [Acidimicrobiaceae bacterium]|nr:hypothetical protein [Acidimicrobiaceae bacterium]|tara:strand:+ start:25 stop:480 length:456 start_codon:yes stop_codon:yes gene_type:complete